MSTARSTATPATPSAAGAKGLIGSWVSFWFAPADPVGLHALRVLGGLLFLLWLLPLAGHQEALFGLGGWFDAQGYREASRLSLPPNTFGWSVVYLGGTNPVALTAIYWLSVAAILLFTLGVATRLTGVLTWVVVVSYTANPALAYDADPLLRILAFYLMVGYLLIGLRSPGQSWLPRLLGSRENCVLRSFRAAPTESVGANLAVRLFQVHFAIAMVASGLHKLQIKEWWGGFATWFHVNPPFGATAADMASYARYAETYVVLFSLASYLILAWQLTFPAFAWRRGVGRVVLLGGAALAWLACALWVPLPLIGPIMVVACLGYLSPPEWRRLLDFTARLPGVRALLSRLSRAPEGVGLAGPKGGAVHRTSAVSVGQR
jgi:hypothetical protein